MLWHSKTVPANARSDGIMHRGHSLCSITHETNTVAHTLLVEASIRRSGNANSKISASCKPSQMVVTGSKHFQGQIFSTHENKQNYMHGCFKSRLGRKFRPSDCARSLATGKEGLAYKLPRVGSCSFDSQKFSSTVSKSVSFNKVRQSKRGTTCKSARGNTVVPIMLQSLGTMAVGNRKQHRTESSSYSGKSKHSSRSVEQNLDPADGMVIKRSGSKQNFSDLGETFDRSVRFSSEQQNGSVLQLGTTSPGICSRCFHNNLASNVCLCISTNLPGSQSVAAYETGAVSTHFDSTTMAEATLVSGSASVMCSEAYTVTNNSSVIESAEVSDISSRSQGIQSECMVAINRQLTAKGFSRRVRDLLSASWRAGTRKDYAGKFRQFSSWCSKRQIDLYSASLIDCAEFLTFLFHKGLQYRTIAGYRSMLSSVLQPIENIPVGQHPYIIRLLKGIFNSRPPTNKLLPEWDLPLVLKMLKKPPFEPLALAPLKYLTWKSLFLTAITTFRRSSDIQALSLGEGNVSLKGQAITFIRKGLSKSDRPKHVNSKVVVPAFKQDMLLDPVRVLKCYLSRTKKFRNFGKDQAKLGLFLSFVEPHNPVTSQTIAKWIVRIIKLAYQVGVVDVKGHSTRAIGPSWALYNGASVNSILEAADWARESTFVRFYLRDVDSAAVLKT